MAKVCRSGHTLTKKTAVSMSLAKVVEKVSDEGKGKS